MFKYLIALFCLLALMILACVKSSGLDVNPTPVTIRVKEYKTNIPLSGVRIDFIKCSKYDNIFGCQQTAVAASHSTNGTGEYITNDEEVSKADEGIKLSKAQYFDTGGGPGDNFMEPEATLALSLKAVNAYPDTALFKLEVLGARGTSSILIFKAPVDSIVNFKLFGNEADEVNWEVYGAPSFCNFFCPEDTLASGKFSLNPQKFEALTHSLDY